MKVSLKSAACPDVSYDPVVGIYSERGHHIATVEMVDDDGEQSIKFTKYVSGLSHCAQAGMIKAASDFIDAEFSGEEQVAEVEV